MVRNKSKLALFAVLILTLCFAVFIISGLLGNRNTVVMFDDILTRPIKASDEYSSVLNAENILQSDISFPFDIKNKLSEKKFKKEFYSLIYHDIHEIQSSVLYGENGCYLSVCGVSAFNVEAGRTVDEVQCFIFTKDLEEAGTTYFNNKGNFISVSVNDTAANTRSAVLKKLSESKNDRYVILKNGLETKFLDNKNNVVKIGAVKKDLEIIGDCYSLLENNGLSVSYNDITDGENLIWFDLGEIK